MLQLLVLFGNLLLQRFGRLLDGVGDQILELLAICRHFLVYQHGGGIGRSGFHCCCGYFFDLQEALIFVALSKECFPGIVQDRFQ